MDLGQTVSKNPEYSWAHGIFNRRRSAGTRTQQEHSPPPIGRWGNPWAQGAGKMGTPDTRGNTQRYPGSAQHWLRRACRGTQRTTTDQRPTNRPFTPIIGPKRPQCGPWTSLVAVLAVARISATTAADAGRTEADVAAFSCTQKRPDRDGGGRRDPGVG